MPTHQGKLRLHMVGAPDPWTCLQARKRHLERREEEQRRPTEDVRPRVELRQPMAVTDGWQSDRAADRRLVAERKLSGRRVVAVRSFLAQVRPPPWPRPEPGPPRRPLRRAKLGAASSAAKRHFKALLWNLLEAGQLVELASAKRQAFLCTARSQERSENAKRMSKVPLSKRTTSSPDSPEGTEWC